MNTIQKLLVIGNRLLGDCLSTVHLVHSAVQAYQPARVDLLAPPYAFPVYRLLGGFSAIYRYGSADGYEQQRFGVRDRFRLFRKLAGNHYDLILVLPGGFEYALAARMIGAPHRVGYTGDGRGWLLTAGCRPDNSLPNYENYDVLRSYLPGRVPPLHFTLPVKNENPLAGKRYVAVSPVASESYKMWPGERFTELCQTLNREHGLTCVFLGVDRERAAIERICHGLPDCINTAGQYDFYTALAILKDAVCFIGNDSGLAHAAANIATPTIVLYGPSNPVLSRPSGPHIYQVIVPAPGLSASRRRRRRYRTQLDMSKITVSEVLYAVNQMTG